jgi:lysophospholipase L1-like esterase
MAARLLALMVLSGFVVAGAPAARAETVRLPNSMAAIGDSITRAFDVCCWYGDHPSDSWSAGLNPIDGVVSHYERILAVKPSIYGHAYDDAASGARMSAGPSQASQAVSQGAHYVTVLLGANDVCTSSPATMTPVATFQSEFASTMATIESGLPSVHVFVASIPNIWWLWNILHANATAEFVWSTFGIGQSMLSTSNSDADRQAVLDREIAFNSILGNTCASYANCRFDGDAVFNYPFAASQVSTLDYFHPSLSGQAALASVTWAASWWPTR